jgi:glycosyltransferase involved in cell wall biosynthesis
LDNPRLAYEIGKNARQKALEDFGLDKMVGDTIKTYYSILESKSQ